MATVRALPSAVSLAVAQPSGRKMYASASEHARPSADRQLAPEAAAFEREDSANTGSRPLQLDTERA